MKVPAEAGADIARHAQRLRVIALTVEHPLSETNAGYLREAALELEALEVKLRSIAATALLVHNCDQEAIAMRQQARIALGGDWAIKVRARNGGRTP